MLINLENKQEVIAGKGIKISANKCQRAERWRRKISKIKTKWQINYNQIIFPRLKGGSYEKN